jgi:hypothetical protein
LIGSMAPIPVQSTRPCVFNRPVFLLHLRSQVVSAALCSSKGVRMQKKIVSLAAPILIGIMALALGWFAHAAVPLSAQSIVVDGHVTRSDPAAPAGALARLTYQGRLSNNTSGAPINTTVSMVFKLYDRTNALLWASTPRSVMPVNGLFTVYLGDGTDPNLSFNTLALAASIGVTVGVEEMTHQALNSVVGHSENGAGVVGSSDTGFGVVASSQSSTGVYGSSNTGVGVIGLTGDATHAGVLAQAASNAGIALEISSGGIKATGAGVGTSTFAFIHVSSANPAGASYTRIDNPLTNGDQNAMLLVTHVLNPTGVTTNVFSHTFGVYYILSDLKWAITTEDGTPFPANVTFNVMVIKR